MIMMKYLNFILDQGGSLVLLSHLGRPKNGPEEKFSLKQIVKSLEQNLGRKVEFSTDPVGSEAEAKAEGLKSGEVLLMEKVD